MWHLVAETSLLAITLVQLAFLGAYAWIKDALSATPSQSRVRPGAMLSRDISDLKTSYDVVVIGSGYGGSIAASELARATPKQTVCVLERGIERQQGDHPQSLFGTLLQFLFSGHIHIPFHGDVPFRFGRRNGLYRWVVGRASSVVVGNGLGGTSLLNAGVFLRPTSTVLESSMWPEEIQAPGSLDEYFTHAETMLEPSQYPDALEAPQKYQVLASQAKAVGMSERCSTVPLLTSFSERVNNAGVQLHASSLSGQEQISLNEGSKNTTVVTYLTDAYSHGAEIYCDCDVRFVEKHPAGGYLVCFRTSLGGLSWVHGKKFVFLGAGSVGSTEIMLRSADNGLEVSDRVGSSLSGNGSMLAFGYDMNVRVNSVAGTKNLKKRPGPTISGAVDFRDTPKSQSFLVQEGTFFAPFTTLFRLVHVILPSSKSTLHRLKGMVHRLFLRRDALDFSQVYLILGHDNSGGRMTLGGDQPNIDMQRLRDFGHIKLARNVLTSMTHAFGGVFKESGVKVTVHPLGGLPFSNSGAGDCGAVSHTGELFTGPGTDVYPGLIAVDGSVIPGSLATNPIATICAVAHRSADLAAKRYGLSVNRDNTSTTWKATPQRSMKDTQLSFSETMEGSLQIGNRLSPISVSMVIHLHPIDGRFTGSISGNAECRGLSSSIMRIVSGSFEPFMEDDRAPIQSKMTYDLSLLDATGKEFHLHGIKIINPSISFSVTETWHATTTMVTVLEIPADSICYEFQMHLPLVAFLRLLRSFNATGPTLSAKWGILCSFLVFFTAALARIVFPSLAYGQFPEDFKHVSEAYRHQKEPPSTIEYVTATDSFQTPLRMWPSKCAGTREEQRDLLFIPGGAVTHEIFALATIKKNAIEHFRALGYRCWIVTHRSATIDRKKGWRSWTAYDARLDIAAAIQAIRNRNGAKPIFIIAHCMGAGALGSGVLDGTIHSEWISGIVASQFLLHPILSPLNRLKAQLPLVKLYRLVAGDWYSCVSGRDENIVQRVLDKVLRIQPQSSVKELCQSSVCLRTQLPFGRLWNHSNLNRATHDYVHEVFTGISIKSLEHVANTGIQQLLTDNSGRILVTDENIEHFRYIPVFLLSSGDSQTYQPESTRRTLELLHHRLGKSSARRQVFEGFGHLCCWMSDAAGKPNSVYDTVAAQLLWMEELHE